MRARNALFVSRKDDIEAVVRITAPIVQAISVSKGAQAVATDLNTHTLTLNVSMGGTLTASGRCDDLVARSQMGGVLDGKSLVCRDVIANASMGGAAQVHATQSIVANAAMGGTIDVTGAPARRDATAFMGGMIGQDD